MADDKDNTANGGWCSAWQDGRRINVSTYWDPEEKRFIVHIYGDDDFEVRNEPPMGKTTYWSTLEICSDDLPAR